MNNVFWIIACGVMLVLLLTVTYDFVMRIVKDIKMNKAKKELKKSFDDLIKKLKEDNE